MIYLTLSDGRKVIVLETSNLEELKKGRPAIVPDKSILISWTGDPVWLADKLMDVSGEPMEVAQLIEDAAKRPQKPPRSYHKPHEFRFGDKHDRN